MDSTNLQIQNEQERGVDNLQFFEIRAKHHNKRKQMLPDKSLVLDRYTGVQAAQYLGLTANMLWRMRNCVGGGPEYFTKGAREYYTKQALDTWAQENLT